MRGVHSQLEYMARQYDHSDRCAHEPEQCIQLLIGRNESLYDEAVCDSMVYVCYLQEHTQLVIDLNKILLHVTASREIL